MQSDGIKNSKKREEKVMEFCSHRIEKSDLEAGDHIYTYRAAYTYSHHGIYVGEGRVVHFTQEHNWSSSIISSSTCISSSDSNFCGFTKGKSGVIISCLDCFMDNGSLRRYKYGVGRCAFIAKRGGTCTTAKSDHPEAVIHRAMYLLYNGFGEYKLLKHNCEDFALYCKTGLIVSGKRKTGGSGQASSAVVAPGAAVGVVVGIALSNPVFLGTATVVGCTYDRYKADIGVRRDVVEVGVENIRMFLSCE